MLHVTVFSSL